jgi:hypothetical protein
MTFRSIFLLVGAILTVTGAAWILVRDDFPFGGTLAGIGIVFLILFAVAAVRASKKRPR